MAKLEDLARPYDPFRPRKLEDDGQRKAKKGVSTPSYTLSGPSLAEAQERRQQAARTRARAIMAKMMRKGQLSDE
ncbi:hypothetical protein [Mesorhizobium sp. ANAO-SY3R2]|uniref:hypothetical protein n=1 Tax=Mesorhizobium sp. ANAO-SY3R2 TaxID=3166644 RepID=UPI00366B5376